jgi:ferric-dicitrate binding protein FerR (iron transport regulator)
VEVTGETYFEVAPDRMMPFIVRKGDVEVQVLGTHFNVNAYDNEAAVRVTLLEGEVKVSQAATGHSVVIRQGEQAEVHSGGNISLDENADTSAAVAWKNGEFRFENTTLTELMRQLERWYNVRVVYTGNVQDYEQRYAFVGEIERSSELPLVLKLLELGGVHFKIKDRDLIVMP